MVRLNLSIILGILFISFLVSYFDNYSFNPILWINILFYCSLILTIFGSAMLVIQGGFFHAITRSFKIFFRKINRIENVIQEIEGNKGNLSPFKVSFKFTFSFLFSGSLLLLFSIFFSWNL